MSFLPGLPANFRRGIDYGFPPEELARIKDRFPHVEVVYDLDDGAMSVWAEGKSGKLYGLFGVQKEREYKVYDDLLDMHYAATNDGPEGSYLEAKRIHDEIERQKLHSQEKMRSHIDPDKIAHEAAEHLGIRGLKGAPGIQVSVPK